MKTLRSDGPSKGWFAQVARNLADLSGIGTKLKIRQISADQDEDTWRMEYRIGTLNRTVETRYPHKYALARPAYDMLSDFEGDDHCFYSFEEQNFDGTVKTCWLPKKAGSKLAKILPDKFRQALR